MKNQEIEALKELATFSQQKLDQIIEQAKSRYESSENFVFQHPGQMLKELQNLYTKGYEPTSEYTHQFVLPSFYSVWLTKPLSVQQGEMVNLIAEAEAAYRADLETYKSKWLTAAARELLEGEESKQAQALKAKREKRLSEITKQLEGEIS